MPTPWPTPLPALSDAPLFLHVAGSLVFVAAAGRGIGWALDAWVRRAPEDAKQAEPKPAEAKQAEPGSPAGAPAQSGARIR
ncbi:hypothetical protein [Methylobacterium aquaticum]|uniref:hypothetical protein n=1 Tax=Methylobacterium aquaticum TaxID=270351 RepID=UPI0019323C44|nr:hypothetical protein [Methylobacterium aquaticum]QRE74254.1 hypothetical protein F1D61_12100 [Methylobacterium aquaticum]